MVIERLFAFIKNIGGVAFSIISIILLACLNAKSREKNKQLTEENEALKSNKQKQDSWDSNSPDAKLEWMRKYFKRKP